MAAKQPALAALALILFATAALVAGLILGPATSATRAARLATSAQSGTFVDSGQAIAEALGVALGDLDGDGDLDAALATASGGAAWINSGGSFADSGQALGSAYTVAVALGDLDGDSDLDIFLLTDTASSNQVWLNRGGAQAGVQGAFAAAGPAFGDDLPGGVALGDVDGDGDLDAFVARNIGRPNKLWLNNGGGGFVDSGQNLGAGSSSGVALGDLDGDGDLDAFVADAAVNTVWLNQGGAQSGTQGVYVDSGQALGDSLSIGVALGDIDRDGDLDAATASVNSGVRLWLNQGGAQAGVAGNFTAGGVLGSSGNRAVVLSDVDGDGDDDLFVARGDANTAWINRGGLQGGAAGAFIDSGQRLGNLFSNAVALADIDGDNDPDALVANTGAPAQIWRNEGLSGAQTAYQIRDVVLAGTARGQHYITLYNTYSPEIASMILADRALFDAGYDALMLWLPGLQTLVDGSGGEAVITQAQVDGLEAFLSDISAQGSNGLRQAIADERAALPDLDSFVGQTMARARSDILGGPANALYLPQVSTDRIQAPGKAQLGRGAAPQVGGGCFMACWLGTSECR